MSMEIQKQILMFFSKIQNPFLNAVGVFFTVFGESLISVTIAFFIFWCIDKKKGFATIASVMCALFIALTVKAIFRVPRPWILCPELSTLRKATATGYSFPSGHSACASSLFYSIFISFPVRIIRVLCIVIIVMVPVSRMYLCCHWPMDVVAGTMVGLGVSFIVYKVFARLYSDRQKCITVLPVTGVIFYIASIILTICLQLGIVDYTAWYDLSKDLTIIGAVFIMFPAELRFVNFSVEGSVKMKTMRFLAGYIGVLLIMVVFGKLLPHVPVVSLIKYTVAVAWGCFYPVLGKKLGLFR